jgi:hypothetical protein
MVRSGQKLRREFSVVESDPVSWRAVVYGTPVLATDGTQVGTVKEVLGDDSEDIFHGLRVALASGGADVVVAAEDIDTLTQGSIGVNLPAAAIAAQPAYTEVDNFHLAPMGRKHELGWQKDSKSDEEPG